MTSTSEILTRIKMEYLEMPGLKLTTQQARRLWGLPGDLCDAALALLVEQGFLVRTGTGSYIRRGGSPELMGARQYAALPDFS